MFLANDQRKVIIVQNSWRADRCLMIHIWYTTYNIHGWSMKHSQDVHKQCTINSSQYLITFFFSLGWGIVQRDLEIEVGQKIEIWIEEKEGVLLVRKRVTKPETVKKEDAQEVGLTPDLTEEGQEEEIAETEDQTVIQIDEDLEIGEGPGIEKIHQKKKFRTEIEKTLGKEDVLQETTEGKMIEVIIQDTPLPTVKTVEAEEVVEVETEGLLFHTVTTVEDAGLTTKVQMEE